jgi:hypothetical protein
MMGLRDLFSQWNTKTVGGSSKLGIDDYSLIQDPVHLEFANAKDIDAINAVGQATNLQSQSGPIPGTFQVIRQDYSTASTATILTPNKGEVWLYIGSSRSSATIDSGSITYTLLLVDNVNSNNLCLIAESSNGTGQAPLWDGADQVPLPIYVDENTSFKLTTSGSFSAVRTEHGFIRVR